MPLNDDETPSQAMKRIEAEVRGTSSAQRNLGGGYSGNVGAQAGPLSGMVMTSSEPTAGQPTMRGVRGALGPISFTHVQPSGRVAPTRTIGVGGAPFDADAYFGVSAAQTPSGRQYGVDVGAPLPAPRTPGGRPYEGAEGSFNAYGQYNPSRRDLNAGFEFRRNFAEGGPFEARPLTIYRKEPPPSAPVGEVESRGPVERPVERPVDYAAAMQTFQDAQKLLEPTRNKAPEPIVVEEPKPVDPYAGLPAGEKYNRQFADTLINAPRSIANYLKSTSEQPDPSQRIAEDIQFAGSALAGIPPAIGDYFARKAEQPDPSQRIAEDIQNLGGGFAKMFAENPIGTILDFMNLPGAVTSLREASEAKKEYEEAVSHGDEKKASDAKNRYAMALPGIIPVIGVGMKAAKKGAQAAERAAARELSSFGLFSHGAESALALPQAKGTPEQLVASLRQAGVKPDELFSAGIGDEAATAARKAQIEAEMTPKVKAAEDAMNALQPGTPEFKQAERQYKNLLGTMRSDMDRAFVLTPEFAQRPSITREEMAQIFKDRMPVVEETVLGGSKKPEMDHAAKERWLDDNAAKSAYNSGDIDSVRDWENASPEIKSWYRDHAQKEFDELMATDTHFASRFQTSGVGGDTKFQQYTLPGGENYREVLLKMPVQGDEAAALNKIAQDMYGKNYTDLMGDTSDFAKMRLAVKREYKNQYGKSGLSAEDAAMFRSSHWHDDPNVLAHIRMSDRIGPNGEKILHVEEIQSDWAQTGRKRGFEGERTPDIQTGNWQVIHESDNGPIPYSFTTKSDAETWYNQLKDLGLSAKEPKPEVIPGSPKENTIPSAPYVTNTQAWTDLALKRVLKEAAEGGYDKVVWTPGVEQAKRYDLSKHIDRLVIHERDGKAHLLGYKNGEDVFSKELANPEKELPELVGKDVAAKLMEQEPHSSKYNPSVRRELVGADLSLGGEGMKGYYDKIVPTQLSKLVKKMDPEAKIGKETIPVARKSSKEFVPSGPKMENAPESYELPSITITPKMREAILGGMPHMAEGGMVGADTESVTQNVMSEIAESGLDRRQIATLLRMASTGTLAPDKAIEFADTILTGNMADMERRFQEYPRSMRILSRVDAAVGGEAALAYGNAANRNPEGPLAYDGGADRGYAKGGSVRRGSANIMKEVREYALTEFGAPTIKGMEARAGGDPAKFIFALNQYTKNLAAQDPQAYGEMYKQQIAAMNEIAKKYNINLRTAFRRDPGIPQTVDKIDEAMGAAKTPVFKEALERMHQILGG